VKRLRIGDRVAAEYGLHVTGVRVGRDAKGTVTATSPYHTRVLVKWDNGERGWAHREALRIDRPEQVRLIG
jgi:hypothetical protein